MTYLNDFFTCGKKEEEDGEDQKKVLKKFHISEAIKKKFKMSVYAGRTLVANRFVLAHGLAGIAQGLEKKGSMNSTTRLDKSTTKSGEQIAEQDHLF